MAFDLGELAISLNLNTTSFTRDLDNAEKRIERFGRRRISLLLDVDDSGIKALDNFQDKVTTTQRWLNRNPLIVRADHSELTELNKHIEAKRQHVKEVQQWLDRNALVVRTEYQDSQQSLKQENSQGQSNTEQNTNALIENTKNFANFAAAPFESVARGLFEGLGQSLAKDIGKGFKQSLQSNLDFGLEDLGRGAGDITAESFKYINDKLNLNIKGNKTSKDPGMPLAIPLQQETRQIEKVAKSAQTALRKVDHAVTKVANVADGVATGLARVVPGGTMALGTAKTAATIAAPFAVAGAAEAFLPGGSALVQGVQQAVGGAMAPMADAISANILGQLLPVVNGTLGALPFGMGAGAAEAATAALTSGVTGVVGSAVGGTAAIVGTGIAGKGTMDLARTAKNVIVGNDRQELKQLAGASEQLKLQAAEVTSSAYQQAEAIAVGFNQTAAKFKKSSQKLAQAKKLIARADSGKQLKPAEVKLIAATIKENRKTAQQIVDDFEAVNQVIEAQVSNMPKSETGFGSKAARLKSRVSGAKNRAQSFLDISDRFIKNPKSELDRQIYGAITVDAVRIGEDTAKGVNKGIDKSKSAVKKAGRDIGENLKRSTKDSLGIQSPSKEYEQIGLDVNRGLAKGLARQDPLTGYNQKVKDAVKQFRSNVTNDKSYGDKSLSGLIQSRIDKGLSTIYQGNPIEQDINRKKIGKLMGQKDKAVELEKLLAERFQQLDPANAIKNPQQYARRLARSTFSDRRIEQLTQELAEFGTEKFFESLYRQGANQFRRKVFKGTDPREARDMAGEVPGFGLAAATMVNPAIGGIAAAAPLALPMLPLAVAGLGLNNILAPIVGQIKEALMTVEPLIKRLDSVSGSPEAGARELDYVRGISSEYNVALKPALANYAQLSVAAKRTKLEGDGVKELFEGISASIRALRLSSADAELVFMAYTQMLSKGKISMEELRQQLGEKFPPAMNIFAKALGVSQTELNDLSAKGALISDEVLPEVARTLQQEFGEAAKAGANDYTSSLAKMENATFELQRVVSDKYGGLFGAITNLGAKAKLAVAGNFDTINKIIGAGLIGISAQVAVGLQAIASSPAIAAKLGGIQTMIMSSFKTGLIATAPFLVGIFADVADDFLGAKNSIFDNMSKGVGNAVISVFSGLDNIKRGLTGNPLFDPSKGNTDSMGGITKGLSNLFKILPSGLVEIGALTLMFEQVTVLGKMFLAPMFANVSKAVFGMADSFRQAFMTGKSLKGIFKTLAADSAMAKAGMVAMGIAAKAALATAVLAFAQGDFSDPLISSFHEAERSIIGSIQSIGKTLDGLKPKMQELGDSLADALPSKGLELNPMKLLGISDESFKSDDLIQSNNKNKGISGFIQKFLVDRTGVGTFSDPWGMFTINSKQVQEAKQRADLLGVGDFFTGNERSLTLGQKQLLNKARDYSKSEGTLYEYLSKNNLDPTSKNFLSNLKKPLSDVKELNREMGELGKRKFQLTLEGTPEAKKEIREIREKTRNLFLQYQEKKKPIADVVEDIQAARADRLKQIEDTNNSNLPGVLKRNLNAPLERSVEILDRVIAKMKELGLMDALEPLSDSWSNVTKELKNTEESLTLLERKDRLGNLAAEKGIYESYTTNRGAAAATQGLGIESLKQNEQRLIQTVEARKAALEKLLSIPQVEENAERAEEIAKLREELIKSEDELAQTQTNLAKSIQQQAAAIRDFELSLKDLELQSLQLDTQALQTQLNLKLKLDPKLNEELFNLSQQVETQLRNNANSLKTQERSLEDFVTSISDYTYSLKDAVTNLRQQSRELINNIAKIKLGTTGAFFDAAGIQNVITDFFGKMGNLASQASDIALSDLSKQINRDLERSERDYERNQKQNQRRKEDITTAFDNTKADSRQAIARLEREITILQERKDIDKAEISIQVKSYENQIDRYNKNVDETKEVSRAYNIPVNLTQKVLEPIDLTDLEENSEAITEKLIAGKQEMIRAYNESIAAQESAIRKGLAEVTEVEKEAYQQQQEYREENRKQLELNNQRVSAETEKLAKTIEGTYLALDRSLSLGVPSLKLERDRLSLGNQELYSSLFGTRDTQPYLTGRTKAGIQIGERELQLKQQQSSLTDFLNNASSFSNAAELRNQIGKLEFSDPRLKEEIIAKLSDDKTQAQIKAIIEEYKNQLAVVNSELKKLEGNKEPLIERAGKIARSRDYLDSEGRKLGAREQLGSVLKESGRLDVFETAKMDRKLGTDRINLDFENQLLDIENLKTATGGITKEYREAYRALESLRDIKLDNLIEQTDVWGQTLKDSVGGGFDTFIETLTSDFGNLDKLWRNTLASMLQVFANFAQQIAKQQLMEWVGGIGGASNQTAGGGLGGLIAGGIMAIAHDGLKLERSHIPNFADGGPIAMFAAIEDAKRRERAAGNEPVLLVAGVGERILNKQQTAEWDAWKSAGVKQQYVPNMAMGGKLSNKEGVMSNKFDRSLITHYSLPITQPQPSTSDTINISIPRTQRKDRLGRSEERQAAYISERVRRAKKRNG